MSAVVNSIIEEESCLVRFGVIHIASSLTLYIFGSFVEKNVTFPCSYEKIKKTLNELVKKKLFPIGQIKIRP